MPNKYIEQTLEQLQLIVSGIHHELRTPVQALDMTLPSIRTALDENNIEEAYENLELAHEAYEDIIEILNMLSNISDVSSKLNGSIRISPSRLLENIITYIKDSNNNLLKNKIDIGVSKSIKPLYIKIKPVSFRQIISNLVRNAADAVKNKDDGFIFINECELDGKYNLCISDNGIGISDEVKEKIWHPFFTTKTGGKGLGMFFVKSIVLWYGGSIDIDSEVDLGTTVKIIFPISE